MSTKTKPTFTILWWVREALCPLLIPYGIESGSLYCCEPDGSAEEVIW